ncbi:DUF4914 family protein [Rubinisphaera italica]|uniref:Uncharacterized protein n=1 Tax=Rubinisphaera italica TaxID=2527969 RepID=A0A5C5XD51_9PLAN|nr:DUF4914 family protein [Rubinisphaera italica]TWT60728.1 hypothetical protein Pan54_14550 [Rubinisphaera italica]
MFTPVLPKVSLSHSTEAVLGEPKSMRSFSYTAEFLEAAVPDDQGYYKVGYHLDNRFVPDVIVCPIKNEVTANCMEACMRQRDQECMEIAYDLATYKMNYDKRFSEDFDSLRHETFVRLRIQDLGYFFFNVGRGGKGFVVFTIIPANAGFFALDFAMVQGIIPIQEIDAKGEDYHHSVIIFIALTFHYSHFEGKLVVVYNRREEFRELYICNLYSGKQCILKLNRECTIRIEPQKPWPGKFR